jgi:hypothetical protein
MKPPFLAVFYYLEKVKMAEPVSSGAGAVAIKMHGLGVFIAVVIALGYLVVVMTRMPRSRSEWVVSLITTVIGSIGLVVLLFSISLCMITQQHGQGCAIGGFSLLRGCRFGQLFDGHLTM